VIQGLSSFWVDRGCALLPPCSLEIPAALLHPKTFFRLLSPQPWRGVVAQPVSRPVDGRRGLHPFRTSVHLQLQVALQAPDSREVQSSVMESLRHLGLDLTRHHLQFDSWHWQLDAVGARGRGWRLTLDGIGIGRITFLETLADQPLGQAPHGLRLAQAPIDITYGVEHLALVLSGVDSVYRLPWQDEGAEALRYDQLRRTDEEEQSRYVEQVANVGYLRQVLDGLEREARRCLEADLVRPAYERAIECLAVLDTLDVRRDLTGRERVEWVEAVRRLVAGAADLHLRRQPAAQQPKPEQTPQPEPQPKPQPKPEAKPTPQPKPEPEPEPQPEPQPPPEAKPKPQPKRKKPAPKKQRSKKTPKKKQMKPEPSDG
jgi:glycyl-tRNA synthetase alpha chain